MSDDKDVKTLERHVAQLGEHFQSVRIIATNHQDGITFTITSGAGNFYAQIASCREWLARQDERVLEHERGMCRKETDE